jgi:predicted methyltransferase
VGVSYRAVVSSARRARSASAMDEARRPLEQLAFLQLAVGGDRRSPLRRDIVGVPG